MADLAPRQDDLLEEQPSRYIVGIDLGTTNSAVAYVDAHESPWKVRTLEVPQLVEAGLIEPRETLPSFHYEAASAEFPPGALRLPWSGEEPNIAVGFFARDHGALAPARLIASAKSWLCHSGVDRTAALLPWHGAEDVEKLSPVDVSSRYLVHIRDAWNRRFPGEPLAKQDLVLTLPASFDEVARELTIQAAAQAGLPRVVLIEEPQAAFYAWIHKHADRWEQEVEPGQKILVCDIGGGTSDFTLIRVRRAEGDKVQFHRVAVGDHLLLGGDNLDLALAHVLEPRFSQREKLTPRQWAVLVRTCRRVKETLLGENAPETVTVNLPGGGARLLGGGRQAEATRDEVRAELLEGFLPRCRLDEKPRGRQSGFQEFGLPFASDAAITRHLAAFLTAHRHVAVDEEVADVADPARPDIVLFNGGFFASPVLRERLLDVLASWFRQVAPDWSPRVLENERLDLAVAHGAAYYGMVRRGEGVRIAAGLARTYYVGVESDEPVAVCLAPAGAEPGQDVKLAGRKFHLRVGEPIEFPLYYSSVRLTDSPGEIIPIDREQMTPLPPIRTVLRTRRKSERGAIDVELHARLLEIGVLDVWCSEVGGERSWRLQFDVRSATQTDIAAHDSAAEAEGMLDESLWAEVRGLLHGVFADEGEDDPRKLVKRLVEATGVDRDEWPTSLLRRIWEELISLEVGRRKSQAHESRWLNLLGYALRPGYGLAADDWRVAETWRLLQGKLYHPSPACRNESWILWRRIGGGLNSGQQRALADPLLAPLRAMHKRLTTGRGRGGEFDVAPQDTPELWRLLGSLELLDVSVKTEMGKMITELLPRRKWEAVRPALVWALGRIGARVPLYGPLNTVVPPQSVLPWLDILMQFPDPDPIVALAVMQIARRTDDRYRDLPEARRTEAAEWLDAHNASQHLIELTRSGGALDLEEQTRIFGESLPKGLRLA
ncbi:MAG: hsp70 family protein [Planctomycetes bacterium]|nr:hsp70 family protein [Planctomycetota bacterium]